MITLKALPSNVKEAQEKLTKLLEAGATFVASGGTGSSGKILVYLDIAGPEVEAAVRQVAGVD